MVNLERRNLIKGIGAVPLGLALSETAEAQSDTNGGEQEWAFTQPSGPVWSSPTVVVDGTVYVGSNDSTLYAVDAGVSGSSEDSRVLQGTLGHNGLSDGQGGE